MPKLEEIFKGAGSLIVLTLAALFCILIVKMSIGLYHGVVHSWQSGITTSTPAEQKAEADAWSKDPTNPKVVAQKCLDHGGTPTFSAWDGRVTSCKGADNKSVNIEVNQ